MLLVLTEVAEMAASVSFSFPAMGLTLGFGGLNALPMLLLEPGVRQN